MTQEDRIRVMIVDDHTVVREGLALLVGTYGDLEIVALASDGEKAMARCAQTAPDVVIMDLSMPGMDGPTTIARLVTDHPEIRCIALTSFLEDDLIQRALKAGAVGYLLKSVSGEQLAAAIRRAARGEFFLDATATRILVQSVTGPAPLGHDLTARERDVLSLLADGATNKEIAKALTLSHGTVRVYVSSILAKLDADNRTEAVALALQHDLVQER
jgi:NarL family two-component system response regulator LiaR